ncbi:MAG TPA: SDR family oxidoreductase [Acidimicrobiia bacterium]|nr:SDR family oxidoreductase [Acidimicrobiia bacterium]
MHTPVALVTGSSSGIGLAFARALAARRYDVVLSARREDRLRGIAAELERGYGRTTEVLVADLATADGLEQVAARLGDADRPIDLLVNNAGFGTAGALWELEPDAEQREIHVNVVAVVRLTQAALAAMVSRGRGGVINVSSVAGYQPTPWGATYGATKAFVSSFTHAVHEELRGTGVRAMVLAPGYTHTEFHEQAGLPVDHSPELIWQDPETVVAAALRAYDRGRVVCTPGPLNTVAAAFSAMLPAGITRRAAGVVTRRTH